jgi:hypothetical protein
VVAALHRTGINRVVLPAALGGDQAPVTELMDVVERIATVDGSTAWCAVIGAGSNVFAGYLPETGARRVFADPDAASATMFAPNGRLVPDGGRYRLTGRVRGVPGQRPPAGAQRRRGRPPAPAVLPQAPARAGQGLAGLDVVYPPFFP